MAAGVAALHTALFTPQVKLLFTLRSPLPRAYSEYLNKVADQLTRTRTQTRTTNPHPTPHP